MSDPGQDLPPHRWRRVKEVFGAALERAPAERSTFLNQACGEGEADIRREVEALLAAHEASDTFLNVPMAPLSPIHSELLEGHSLGPYRVLRTLGRGGMATVYLARDERHRRAVALKVLHPELAHALGPERFQREIRLAARLQHPHILTVHDSGEANGLLYYAMPFVEGESLRDRLRREKQLSIEEALRIAREVAAALGYAHGQGVIHRDIKPENILLAAGHALVADFGIARAFANGDANVTERLTETGMAIGTAAYMSPEQSSGSRDLDGRSDIYSLACVLYELLVGATPFVGPSGQALMAQHAIDPVPPLRTRRVTVAPGVEQAVIKALAKAPADRFATAAQFSAALAAAPALEDARPRGWLLHRRVMVVGTTLLLGLVLLTVVLWRRRRPAPSLNPNLVVVAPFSVSRTEPTLAYLREGMVDLLAAKLTGQGGPQAADPRAVLSAWRRASSTGEDLPQGAALQVAEQLGAGQLLLGNVVAAPGRITLNAAVLTVPLGRATTQTSVEGPADSLPALVDRLAARLLTLGAGEGEQRLASLTSTSFIALRAYLDGKAMYRRGRFAGAIRSFDQALQLDSTFALAAVWLLAAGLENAGEYEPVVRGQRLAIAARDRLNPRDLAFLSVLMGMSNAATTSYAELLRQAERFVELAPDRAEAYALLGGVRFAYGEMLGFTTAPERAAAAYRRALELDSTFVPALAGLLVLAARSGDTATVRWVGGLYRAIDSLAGPPDWIRWRMAVALGDRVDLERVRARFDSMGGEHLMAIGQLSQYDGLGLEDAERAHQVWLRRESRGAYRRAALAEIVTLALNRGRPAAAFQVREQEQEGNPGYPRTNMNRVMDALYWDGDTVAGAAAARELGDSVSAMAPNDGMKRLYSCALEQWRLAHGQLGTARRTIALLRGAKVPQDDTELVMKCQGCAILLDALLAAAEQRSDAGLTLARLDSLMRTGPPYRSIHQSWNLVVARLKEARGDRAGALAATRRRLYDVAEPLYLSTYLREEGRLAALTGDREGAIHAYQHYLALRADPEPALRRQVEQVRAELAQLLSEPKQ